jgi:hypothetical protein
MYLPPSQPLYPPSTPTSLSNLKTISCSPERSLDSIQVVRTDGDESSLSAQVVVQLVLEVDERLVFRLVERSRKSQDGRGEVRSERGGLRGVK